MFQHYLLTPYNGCTAARNTNTSITCLIVQSKNGFGFNPCHLSLATDLKLAHWTLETHTHMTLKHEHLVYSLQTSDPFTAFKLSERSWLWTTCQLKRTPASEVFPIIIFFNISMQPAFQMVRFPDQNQSQ